LETRRRRRAEAAGSAGVPEAVAAAAEVGAAGPKADRDIGNRMGSVLVGRISGDAASLLWVRSHELVGCLVASLDESKSPWTGLLFYIGVSKMATSHSDLCNLYVAQQHKYSLWRAALFDSAVKLANQFGKAIEAPESYQDLTTNRSRPYVSLVNFTDAEKPFSRHFKDDDINEQGVLRVKLCLVLETGPNSFPKSRFLFPIGIQFLKGVGQYCFWDSATEEMSEGASWASDLDRFIGLIQQRCAEFFAHDPMDGFGSRSNFGFLQS